MGNVTPVKRKHEKACLRGAWAQTIMGVYNIIEFINWKLFYGFVFYYILKQLKFG